MYVLLLGMVSDIHEFFLGLVGCVYLVCCVLCVNFPFSDDNAGLGLELEANARRAAQKAEQPALYLAYES